MLPIYKTYSWCLQPWQGLILMGCDAPDAQQNTWENIQGLPTDFQNLRLVVKRLVPPGVDWEYPESPRFSQDIPFFKKGSSWDWDSESPIQTSQPLADIFCQVSINKPPPITQQSTPTEPESSGNLKMGWPPPINKHKCLPPINQHPAHNSYFCWCLWCLRMELALMLLMLWFLMLADEYSV